MICAVLGSPVAHSLSPAMHRAAYAELGLDWTYDAVELAEGELRAFVDALGDDVRGFSITAPLKREAAEVARDRSDLVELLGIANTLVVEDGVLAAHNTDIGGATAALEARDLLGGSTARIIGGGATATSLAYVLAEAGFTQLDLVVRDLSRAQQVHDVAERRGVDVRVHTTDEPLIDKVDLLVSTVPGDALASRSYEFVDASRAVFDVVYDPWPTKLAAAADEAGVPLVTGLNLLANQAALQVELMTGSSVRPQLLHDVALSCLESR